METETLSKYDQERPKREDNISHVSDQFVSASENDIVEEELKTKGTNISDPSILIENDSDEEVEEEEKLMLSPTHSEKDYDSDESQESADETRKEDDSDEEDFTKTGEKQGSEIVDESESNKQACEVETAEISDGAEEEVVSEKKIGDVPKGHETGGEVDNVEVKVGVEENVDDKVPGGEINVNTTKKTSSTLEKVADTVIESSNDAKGSENTVKNSTDTEVEETPAVEEKIDSEETEEFNNKDEHDYTLERKDESSVEVNNSEGKDENEENKDLNEESSARTDECSLLKETLTKPKEVIEEEMDMDEIDFDPSLLCPDMSMEVEENSVITDNDALPPDSEASKGVLSLCEPIFSTFVDEITGAEVNFGLSLEEISLREETYGQKNPVQFTKIHCTACNVHLGSALDGQGNRFVHPLLKVLICKKCYHFYTSGEFEKDEDGSELYCRWCGQGGQVMCCSECEMVFCKKCIRINFDKRKMTEIRDSEEWKCFACNPTQLIHLRIHCSSFMDYVQREMTQVAAAEDQNAFLHTDYSRCCLPTKKKTSEVAAGEPKRKRRRNDDPDYDPYKEEVSTPPPLMLMTTATPSSIPNRLIQQHIKPEANRAPKIAVTRTLTTRPMGQLHRPKVQVINPAAAPSVGYTRIQSPALSTVRHAPSGSVRPAFGQGSRPPVLRPIRPLAPSPMKHEWFEKTVRAAARVNSNLSYTLTQLNRAQANATSVEGLAVVHNKLQEILSTSINSLIQIRKNLRSEFIVGIKNIRFPAKTVPAPTASKSAAIDDDVIIVSPSSSPPPPLLVPAPISLPPSVSLFKRSPTGVAASSVAGPSASYVAGPSGLARVGGGGGSRPFLRVKSFSALQNVSSECITIPDDPPILKSAVTPAKKSEESDEVMMVEDSPLREDEKKLHNEVKEVEKGAKEKKKVIMVKVKRREVDDEKVKETGESSSGRSNVVLAAKHLTNGDPSKIPEDEKQNNLGAFEIKKFLNTKIVIEKSNEIDELAKNKFGLQQNGGSGEL